MHKLQTISAFQAMVLRRDSSCPPLAFLLTFKDMIPFNGPGRLRLTLRHLRKSTPCSLIAPEGQISRHFLQVVQSGGDNAGVVSSFFWLKTAERHKRLPNWGDINKVLRPRLPRPAWTAQCLRDSMPCSRPFSKRTGKKVGTGIEKWPSSKSSWLKL